MPGLCLRATCHKLLKWHFNLNEFILIWMPCVLIITCIVSLGNTFFLLILLSRLTISFSFQALCAHFCQLLLNVSYIFFHAYLFTISSLLSQILSCNIFPVGLPLSLFQTLTHKQKDD